jgi:hypothetical protein
MGRLSTLPTARPNPASVAAAAGENVSGQAAEVRDELVEMALESGEEIVGGLVGGQLAKLLRNMKKARLQVGLQGVPKPFVADVPERVQRRRVSGRSGRKISGVGGSH